MKTLILSLIISILLVQGSFGQQNNREQDNQSVLNFYLQYSTYTDPGEYAYLYENLPDSLPELCNLVRSQFIHAYAELNLYRDQIPKERWNEAYHYPGVRSILEGLVSLDSSGFTNIRKPEDRLVLICRHNAITLASILKYKGIPARVRYGHATYLIPNFHTSHAICEVWNMDESRWMLVDPSMDMIDFSQEKFDISNDAWLQMQNGEIDPNLYGIPGRYSGMGSILAKLCGDLACILGNETPVTNYPPLMDYIFEESQIPDDFIKELNKISVLMKSLDSESLAELQEVYDNTPEIQMTESFNFEVAQR